MWKIIKKYVHYNISDIALNADHITREQLESWLKKQCEKTQGKSALEASKEEKIDNQNLSEEEQVGMGKLGIMWQKKALIKKACEWLLHQEEMIGVSFEDDFIERFKKEMEEQI